MKVTGGTLVIDADGDGFDSNGTAEITGGTLVVNGPEAGGSGALDGNGSFTVSGGVLLAAGSAGMAVAPDEESGQGWLSATLDSSARAARSTGSGPAERPRARRPAGCTRRATSTGPTRSPR